MRSALCSTGRARFRHGIVRSANTALLAIASSLSLIACSEVTHTVGVSDVNAVSSDSGQGGSGAEPPPTGGTGGMTPIEDSSTGLPDATIPDAAPQCADDVVAADVRKRLNLYFMVDPNFLVTDSGAWDKVRAGILEYAQRPEAAGTGLGLRVIDPPDNILLLLPTDQHCLPETYSRTSSKAAEQAPLPMNLTQITRALPIDVTGTWTTPLAPALQGAIDLAFSLKNRRPEDDEQAVVLITDAFLDLSCASNAQQLTENALRGRVDQGIRSYMVELLNPIPLLPDPLTGGTLIPLDPVALAGGTGFARSYNLSDDNPSVLADRLLEIQRDAEPCEYAVPSGSTADEALLAVDTGMGPGPLTRLNDETECGAGGGAYVKYVDPTSGTTWVRACQNTCRAIKDMARPPVWIIGCDPSEQ